MWYSMLNMEKRPCVEFGLSGGRLPVSLEEGVAGSFLL